MIKSIVIATHVFSPGTSQAFRDYCLRKKMDVLFIGQPWHGNIFNWTLAAVNAFWQVIKTRKKFDLYVGSNRVNAFLGILLKKIGRIKKVIYFSPDWSEKRFSFWLASKIYLWLDYFCLKYSDLVWNSSAIMPFDPMMKAREKRGYPRPWRSKQIQVPDGTDPFPFSSFDKIERFSIGFVGHLRKGMGLLLLVSAFAKIARKIPRVKLLIIGSGPLEEKLKKKAKGLNVEFTGFMGDLSLVYKRLSRCAIAAAPYQPDSISQHSDPGKVKIYLGIGLPVIITKVPQVAWEIEKEKCGLTVRYNKDELVEAAVRLLKNEKMLKKYRKSAYKLSKKYSWDNIFDRALSFL